MNCLLSKTSGKPFSLKKQSQEHAIMQEFGRNVNRWIWKGKGNTSCYKIICLYSEFTCERSQTDLWPLLFGKSWIALSTGHGNRSKPDNSLFRGWLGKPIALSSGQRFIQWIALSAIWTRGARFLVSIRDGKNLPCACVRTSICGKMDTVFSYLLLYSEFNDLDWIS